MSISSNINKLEEIYILNNLTISSNLNIKKTLRSKNIVIDDRLSIGNSCIVKKDLNIKKHLNWVKIPKYGLLNVESSAHKFDIKNNLNQYFNSILNNINVNNNTIFNLKNKNNYNSNILIKNNFKCKNISCNSSVIYGDLISNSLNVFKTTYLDNINTDNLIIKKNANSLDSVSITVDKNLIIEGGQNTEDSSIKVNYDGFIDTIMFKNNSNLILKTNNTIKNIEGALKINSNKNTLEGYYNNKWQSISHLYNHDYTSFIDFKNYDINFYQNNNLTTNINNKFNINLNTIFKESVYCKNVESNNLDIKNSLILNNNFINTAYVKLPYGSTDTGKQSYLRFNQNTGKIEYYSNQWENIGLDPNIIRIDNSNTLIIQSNNVVFNINKNSAFFNKNVNITENSYINNINIKYNTTLTKEILINNNPIIINNNTNKLFIKSASNYNKFDLKLLEINPIITNEFFYQKYISDYLYVYANYDSYSYCLSNHNHNNNLIPGNYNNFIYHYFGTETININTMEFIYFSNNNQINLYIDDLNNLSNHFSIIIYDYNNHVIYNSNSSEKTFLLVKNQIYTIKIKILNIQTLNVNTNIYIRFFGYYKNKEILFKNNNSDINFLFNIDSHFYNNVNFVNNLNLLKDINIYSNLNTKKISIDNLYINSNNNNSSIILIKNKDLKKIFENTQDKIILGNLNIINNQNNQNLFIKNDYKYDTLYIKGNTIITKNINVNNQINIKNDLIVNNDFKYNSINTNYIVINNNLNINNNINCQNIVIKNLYSNYNNNSLDNLIINNINNDNKIIHKSKLVNSFIDINDSNINFNNKLLINYLGKIALNSDEIIDTFSIGNKLNPNLTISNNGYTKINCQNNGFFINNINIIKELNILKSNII